MNTIIVNQGKKKSVINLPENWNELTRKQFIAVAPLIYTRGLVSLMVRFAHILLGSKVFKKVQDDESYDELIHSFDFLAEPILNKSFFKGFRLFGRRWFGVDDNLADLELMQFIMAEACLEQMNDEVNQKIFFSSVHPRGIFNFLPLSFNKRAAIRLNYEANRAHMLKQYPGLKPSEDNKKPDYHAMLIKISGGKHGTVKETERALVHNVLKDLELIAIEIENRPAANGNTVH